MIKCPLCGGQYPIKVIPLTRQGASTSSMIAMNLDAPWSSGGYSEEPVTEEMRAPTVESDVRVPLYLALITGGAVTLGTLTLALLWGYYEWYWPWYTPIVAGVGAALLWWFGSVNDIGRLVRKRKGQGSEVKPIEVVQVEITHKGDRQMVYANFPAKPRQVRQFAADCLSDRLAIDSSRLSRRIFGKLRDEAVRRGLLVWKNEEAHAQGCELTAVGRHVFKTILD